MDVILLNFIILIMDYKTKDLDIYQVGLNLSNSIKKGLESESVPLI